MSAAAPIAVFRSRKPSATHRNRFGRRLTLLVLGLFAAMLALAANASAHAVLVESTPSDGQRLQSVPSTVTVKFDESVGLDLGYLKVVNSSGTTVSTGTAFHPGGDGTEVRVAMRSGLGDGTYLASYRVISADSHPIGGAIRFVVGNGALGAVAAASSTNTPADVTTALAVAHWLGFAGLAIVGGSWVLFAFYDSGRRRPPIRRLIWGGWILAVLGAAGEFVVQGPYDAGSNLASVSGHLIDATAHSTTGQLLSVRLILLGVVGWAMSSLLARGRRSSWGAEAAAIVGVGVIVTYAASGHAQSASPRWLAVGIDAAHLLGMVAWLGGLVVLVTAVLAQRRAERRLTALVEADPSDAEAALAVAQTVDVEQALVEIAASARPSAVSLPVDGDDVGGYGGYGDDDYLDDYESVADLDEPEDFLDPEADGDELAAGLPIFSRVALISIVVLGVTGVIQAWREVGVWGALFTTDYGVLVVAKAALFVLIVALGWLARRVLVRSSGRTTLQVLRRTLVTEVAVGAVVLGVTAVLIAQPPGKVALDAQHAKAVTSVVTVGPTSKAMVQVNPGTHGTVTVGIDITGTPRPVSVTATASLPSRQLGPITLKLQATGPASYSASGVNLPSAGDWVISIVVQTSQFDATTTSATIHLY